MQSKRRKVLRVDNISSVLLKNGGEATTTGLIAICQKILETKVWPKDKAQSLVIPLQKKKGNLKQCQSYPAINHPGKIMLRVILTRLKTKAEELLAEEQAGFRPGRSTVEQNFNSRVIIEKHLQHQRDLFNNFIDVKKAFDRVGMQACGRSSEAST